MRTRFLCIDYFTPFYSTLDFLRFSPPRDLLSSHSGSISFSDFFRSVSEIDLLIELPPLRIDFARERFLNNVVPSNIIVHDPIELSEKSQTSFDSEEDSCIEVVEFEVPQMDISLEDGCFSEKKLELFFDILEADNNPGSVEADLTFHYPSEALESVYLVDDIASGGHMEQKPLLLEDASSVQDQVHQIDCIFPLFEVDELSMEITSGLCIEEDASLLDKIETVVCVSDGEVVDDEKELLGSLKIDILELISGPTSSKDSFTNVMECSDSFVEIDLVSIIELSYLEGSQAYQKDDISISLGFFNFEEFQNLDLSSHQLEDVLYNLSSVSGAEICVKMPPADLMVKDFNELIVSHELTPIDESFKSLPIPILSDYGKISSHHELVMEILFSLEPQPSSTSDDIYLDWQFLEGDYGNNDKYSSCWKQVFEMHKFSINPNSFIDGMVIFDFVFNSETPNMAKVEDNKETLHVHSVAISTKGVHQNDISISRLNHDECQKRVDQETSTDINSERVSSVVRSMSPFDNLNFFLNPREVTAGKSSKRSVKVIGGVVQSVGKPTDAAVLAIPSLDQNVQCVSVTVQPQPWDLELHQVHLSGCVWELIDKFQKNYLAILKGESVLANIQPSNLATDDTALLSLPKNVLLNWIKKANERKEFVTDAEDTAMALVTLCAIKQMAWYLCYFGVHPTYIYLKQLCQTLNCLENKLSFLQILVEDAHEKTKRDITESHPSLSVIQSVLQSQMNNGDTKILIVADLVLWLSLKIMLTSLHITYCDQLSLQKNKRQLSLGSNFEFPEAIQHSDCLIISTEQISPSFPFDKFSIILEYGGSCTSSTISTISPNPLGSPALHFFKLELEESCATKALCEGVGMPCSTSSPTELEQVLDFIPSEEKYHIGSSRHDSTLLTNKPNVPLTDEPEKNFADTSSERSFPDTLIIVNTQNMNRDMIISRRSTYQKILAMEKRGAQVVERDLKFPVDVIIHASMCLVWYDCGNIRSKATAPDEASSSLPMCIEHIAANILTSLSFSFSCCILVFEGESNFLSAVMESSDGLYAAAFSLRMDLQLFLSHSAELTDEIILNCIGSSSKLNRHIYPKIPESETIAESFLTSFPSLNPLSAHAILSSGGTLIEFLEWSHERRLRAIQKYHVPKESFRLLNTLCKYGEKEDSRSAMTDCSSSVSSAPESRSCFCKPESVKKAQNIQTSHKIDSTMDELFDCGFLNQFGDDNWNQPKVSKAHNTWTLEGGENFDKVQGPGFFSSELSFHKKQGIRAVDASPMMTPSKVSQHIDCQMPKGSTSYEMKKRSWPFDGDNFGSEKVGQVSSLNKFNFDFNKKSRKPHEDLRGEVIDLSDSFPVVEDFSSMPNSTDLPGFVLETDSYTSMGNSRTARRLSFNEPHLPTFPTSAEISADFNVWNDMNDKGRNSNNHTILDFSRNILPQKHKNDLSEEGFDQREATSFSFQSVRERQTQQPSVSTLANAVLTAQPQQGSPWTIEFLNKIRDKSRLRQQALPPNMSPLCSPFLKNPSKGTKRKSPSILDFYRYQGGSTRTPNKISEQKRQRRSSQPPASAKKVKTVPSSHPGWTPLDKRAQQTLSFSTGGSGGQSKLIWSDKNAQNMKRRFYQ